MLKKLGIEFLLCVLLNSAGYSQQNYNHELTLEDIYKKYLFYPKQSVGIKSMNDGQSYTMLEDYCKIVKYDYLSGEKQEDIFIAGLADTILNLVITDYSFSNDESVILLTTEKEDIYRHSFFSEYYVYIRKEMKLIPVYTQGKQKFAALSPDGHYVAFVFENNLYLNDLQIDSILQLTTDGKINQIINGGPDWVYEEEFALTTGFYWSPDSRKIAYYRFDESNVKTYSFDMFTETYPNMVTYKYPLAGDDNSNVNVFVYDLKTGKSQKMNTSDEIDQYIPRIKWHPGSKEICVTLLNRQQNRVELAMTNAENGNSRILYSENNPKFISECTDDFITFVDSGKSALIMSEKSGFMHFYRYAIDGSFINQVTSGEWEVDKFSGIDERNKTIFYTSTEVSPLERHIYSISYDGNLKKKLTSGNGSYSAIFSHTFDYYFRIHSTANSPQEIGLFNKENKLIRIIEDNKDLKERMKQYGFSSKEFFQFKNSEGDILNAYQILPPGFRKNKKYPVFINVYGGPGSQEVLDKWDYDLPWFELLAQKGYIIVCADNRGTGGRGERFAKSSYLQLGKFETEDQIAIAKYMAGKSYVDKERIGVFGWSYGGYMSLLCLMKGNELFKAAISVAPITNWRYYDNIYTERYMRTPQENPEGYDDNSPENFVDSLNGRLLLIHGTADDNVHIANSMMLIKKLIDADKQFEMQIYPNKNHNILGGNTRYHLYNRITDFILKNL